MLHVAQPKQPYQESLHVLELDCHVDAFCQLLLPHSEQELRVHGQRIYQRSGQLAMNERMTIVIYFYQCALVTSKRINWAMFG